jgi:hypothetical protein
MLVRRCKNKTQLAYTHIPFLIVEAVRAPTAKAPVISKIKHKIIACLYVTEREDTEVAQALATSSEGRLLGIDSHRECRVHVYTTYLHHCCKPQGGQTLCRWRTHKCTLP